MINTSVPIGIGGAMSPQGNWNPVNNQVPIGYDSLVLAEAISFQDDSSCLEKCLSLILPCFFNPRWKVKDVQNGSIGNQTHYTIKMTSCVCPQKWTVYEGETDKEVATWTKNDTCNPFEGGPGFKIDTMTAQQTGETWVPCQFCNVGVDIKDPTGILKYYIGSNWECETGCNCCCPTGGGGCCKNEGGCCKIICDNCSGCDACPDEKYPAPIWDSTKSLRVGTTTLVIPCISKCIPCMGEPYFLVAFPQGSDAKDKMSIISAHLLFDSRFLQFMTSGRM